MSELAVRIVDAVLDDLGDRKGIGAELDSIDTDVREELRDQLVARVDQEVAGVTVVAELLSAIEKMAAVRDAADSPAVREFALAITAVEDAAMRYTRGRAMQLGVFKPADLDSRDAIEERHEWTGEALRRMDRDMGDAGA